MKLAVISDLHLGPGGRADGFGHRDAEFLKFLDHLEDNFEQVILLGDIWETLTSLRPLDAVAGLRASRAAHPEIARRLEGPRYRWVHGNHDLVAGPLGLAPAELTLEVGRTRLLFTHGHLYDVIVRRARWMSELGVWLGGWLRRLGLSPMYRLFEGLDRWRDGYHSTVGASHFQTWAAALARRRGADVVITGHTHVAQRAEIGGQLFLNSGSCTAGRFSFLSLDTAAGQYAVCRAW